MKRLTSLLLAVLLLAVYPASAGPSPAISTPELVAATKPAIVLITTYDANGQAKGEGTGFVISNDGDGLGRIVTSAHIIKDANVIRLTNLNGRDYVFHGIMGYDEQIDLAILLVQSPGHQPLAFLSLADSKSVQEGQHILVIGNPEGLYGTISDGIISSIRHQPQNWLQITAPISPGSSGSPVMNDRGEVVGVVKAFRIEGQNLNIAVPVDQIERVAHAGSVRCPVLNDYSDPNNERGTTPLVVATPTPLPQEGSADYYRRRGFDELDRLGNYQGAIADFNKAIGLDPRDSNSCAGLGHAHSRLKQYSKAISEYTEAIRREPDYPYFYKFRADAYRNLKQYDKAITDYNRVIRLNPDDHDAPYQGRAFTYYQLEQYDKAISDYNKAIQLNPNDDFSYECRGSCYRGLKQYRKAINDFDEAIQLNPDLSVAYEDRAEAYKALGKYSQAEQDRRKAKELVPK